MLKQVLKKIKNKKWLSLCLVLGLTFLIATLSCHPMFKAGSLDKLLNRYFEQYIETENKYPTVLSEEDYVMVAEYPNADAMNEYIAQKKERWQHYVQLPVISEEVYYYFTREATKSTYADKGYGYNVSYMPALEEHAEILFGDSYSTYEGDGIPCVISEYIMDRYKLVVGEEIEFKDWKNAEKETLKLRVAGVFKEKESDDIFWEMEPNEMPANIFVSKEAFDEIASEYVDDFIFYSYYQMLDYRAITHRNAETVGKAMTFISGKEENFRENISPTINQYIEDKKTIDITLWVLELPILGMVLTYIYMVTCQIIDTEKNEIAMIKSRGGSRLQVIAMYLFQSVLLSVVGLVLGLPLGYLLCKIGGGTTDFLSFSFAGVQVYQPVWEMVLYGLAAVVGGIIFLLIPVIVSSGISIVQRKSNVKVNKKAIWEKFFFDVILLGVAVYLIYNFNQNMPNIRETALLGQKMDPVIFLDAVLFILSLGLFSLRLVQYLVKLIYHIGRKKWKPAMYASFLQITRTFSKQSIISVFLIVTLALGLFYANIARTINSNSVERIRYNTGADVVVSEQWEKKYQQSMGRMIDYEYIEPDFVKYNCLLEEGLCERITRVVYDNNVEIKRNTKKVKNVNMQGIITDEYGKTAFLKDDLNGEKHWYHYLNAISQEPQGIIISTNLAEELDIKVGDSVDVTRFGTTELMKNEERGTMKSVVCAIVDNWPGYEKYYYNKDGMKENYLVVMNYAMAYACFEVSPYEVWMKLADGVSAKEVEEALDAMELSYPVITGVEKQVQEMKESTLIQITNGMFTLSFVIALVLCAVGFMIYWIASIRQRELLFGVYRAMGMPVRDINKMLINEHIFSTLLSVLTGAGVGMIATVLFAELFGVVYLPQLHNIDIFLHFDMGDITKIAIVVILMMVVCLMVLRNLIKSMNITQALKLGED